MVEKFFVGKIGGKLLTRFFEKTGVFVENEAKRKICIFADSFCLTLIDVELW